MLILTRKKDESIVIDGNIEIQIISIEDGKVKIGINAPKDIAVYRSEVIDKIKANNIEALETVDSFDKLSKKLQK